MPTSVLAISSSKGSNSSSNKYISDAFKKDLKYLFCGGWAGCISRTAVAPLERLKILFQVQDMLGAEKKYCGIRSSLSKIMTEEGVRGLFKGNGTNCVRVFPYAATQFLVFEKLQSLLRSADQDLGKLENLFAGATAGMVSVCVTYPLDAVRARLTVQEGITAKRYDGICHALKSVAKEEGVLALYRGIRPTLLGIAPYVGLNFMTFEALKASAPVDEVTGRPDVLYLLGCGAVAGMTGQTAAYPLDLLRRRFQLASLANSNNKNCNTSIRGAIKEIVAADGVLGLYKGLWPNFIKVVPSVAVMFVSNDLLKRLVL